MEMSSILEFLNGAFVILIGSAILKALWIIIEMRFQLKDHEEDIKELQSFTGLKDRRVSDIRDRKK